jgi:TPR repeat protein
VIEVLALGYLFEDPPEQNKRLKKITQQWISEKKWNYLTALGYLLLIRDDSDFAINLLEESANLGDSWALVHLEGNAKSLTYDRREGYLLRAFEQGHGMAAFRLACLSIEKNDLDAANSWLIKGCLLGSTDSTEALSRMVSSEDEKLMLSKIATEQRGWESEEE